MEPRPNRYELPITTMVGAMLVVLVVVGGFVAFRGLIRDNAATPVRTVEYAHLLQQGKQDGKLSMLSPVPVPSGWRATSARYRGGVNPQWHLGMLTSGKKYVGLEQAREDEASLIKKSVMGDVSSEGKVDIEGTTWQSWKASKGDYVLTRTDGDSVVLVRGSAPKLEIQAFAGRLKAA